MDLNIEGKSVIIPYSFSGLGKAIAEGFLNEGARVLLNGIDKEDITSIYQNLGMKFGAENVNYYQSALNEETGIKNLIKKALYAFSQIDIIVCNLCNYYLKNVDFSAKRNDISDYNIFVDPVRFINDSVMFLEDNAAYIFIQSQKYTSGNKFINTSNLIDLFRESSEHTFQKIVSKNIRVKSITLQDLPDPENITNISDLVVLMSSEKLLNIDNLILSYAKTSSYLKS